MSDGTIPLIKNQTVKTLL